MVRLRMTTVTATTTATVAVALMTGECRSSGALNTPVAAEAPSGQSLKGGPVFFVGQTEVRHPARGPLQFFGQSSGHGSACGPAA